LDPDQISELIARNKVLLPLMTTSEDENPSMGSFNVQDSKLDIILKQIGLSEHKIIENYQQASIENIEVMEDDEPIKKSNDFSSSKEVAVACGRASKNSVRSAGSKKSGKPGNSRLKRTKKTSRSIGKTANPLAIANSSHRLSDRRKEKKKERESINEILDSSFTSFNSEQNHGNGLLHDSFSGVSLANSRNSKRSVDVGIQANAHEIGLSFEFKDKVLKNEENEDIYTENHKLLTGKSMNGKVTQTPRRRNTNEMSLTESEKLKLLLLPSK
jgi:smoothened protein